VGGALRTHKTRAAQRFAMRSLEQANGNSGASPKDDGEKRPLRAEGEERKAR